jgi:hypothetical protein
MCDICGGKFGVNRGEEWRSRCPECSPVMRDSLATCPGCNHKFRRHRMELVSIQVQPGKKGGKKYKVLYCHICLMSVKARSKKLEDQQDKEWNIAKGVQRQWVRDMRGR